MDAPWYLRLFYVPILNFVISLLLLKIINAQRMTSPGPGKSWQVVHLVELAVLCVLMWFVPFRINLAFWIGICIVALGHVVFALGYSAMREHPEKKKAVVDWGVYAVSRHSHVLAGQITTLGAIVIGWNFHSIVYILLWVYFASDLILMHFAIVSEERINVEKFGKAYEDYMQRVPRYFLIK